MYLYSYILNHNALDTVRLEQFISMSHFPNNENVTKRTENTTIFDIETIKLIHIYTYTIKIYISYEKKRTRSIVTPVRKIMDSVAERLCNYISYYVVYPPTTHG